MLHAQPGIQLKLASFQTGDFHSKFIIQHLQ